MSGKAQHHAGVRQTVNLGFIWGLTVKKKLKKLLCSSCFLVDFIIGHPRRVKMRIEMIRHGKLFPAWQTISDE